MTRDSTISTGAKRAQFERHPCFSGCASKRYGRVHLPVATGCNIRCNYCDRRYSCVNESRPGVTGKILSAESVHGYLREVTIREPRISVVGIAGPGDPLHRAEVTLKILREVRKTHPRLLLCLSTNGLNLPANVDALVDAGVSHVTVTVNAVDPAIGEQIYARVSEGKIDYLGREAARLLLNRQLTGIQELKRQGIIVKVNTVVIPGVNDRHITDVARQAADIGVDLMNCIAMIPVRGTMFGDKNEPSRGEMKIIRDQAARYVPQMRHCTRCRADAYGMLGKNNESLEMISENVAV